MWLYRAAGEAREEGWRRRWFCQEDLKLSTHPQPLTKATEAESYVGMVRRWCQDKIYKYMLMVGFCWFQPIN